MNDSNSIINNYKFKMTKNLMINEANATLHQQPYNDVDITTLIIEMHRQLRDHSLTTRPGSGFISPESYAGVDGGVGAFIGCTVFFIFFSSLYLMWRVYIRGKRFVPLVPKGIPMQEVVVVKKIDGMISQSVPVEIH
jgi:hypothetical protein